MNLINNDNINIKTHTVNVTNCLGYLDSIVPSNIFAPFIDHKVISVLIISILIGVSISYIVEDDYRNTISNFFNGVHSMFIIITSWIVKIIPIALFVFVITTTVQLKTGLNINGLGKYLIIVVLANIIQGFIILLTLLLIHKINTFIAMKGMLPALSVAFFLNHQ